MTQRKHVTCRLCRGTGFLKARHPLDDAEPCLDCDGKGVVKRGTPEHALQAPMSKRGKKEDYKYD